MWKLASVLLPAFLLGLPLQDGCGGGSDQDGDGWSTSEGDCDDRDASVYPGATESCNGIDDDCDGDTDDLGVLYPDQDGDGYGDADAPVPFCAAPTGYVSQAGDCDDTDATIYPGAPELCDQIDNDCSGAVDDVPIRFSDQDGDGYGDPAQRFPGCDAPQGSPQHSGDCDDADPR